MPEVFLYTYRRYLPINFQYHVFVKRKAICNFDIEMKLYERVYNLYPLDLTNEVVVNNAQSTEMDKITPQQLKLNRWRVL